MAIAPEQFREKYGFDRPQPDTLVSKAAPKEQRRPTNSGDLVKNNLTFKVSLLLRHLWLTFLSIRDFKVVSKFFMYNRESRESRASILKGSRNLELLGSAVFYSDKGLQVDTCRFFFDTLVPKYKITSQTVLKALIFLTNVVHPGFIQSIIKIVMTCYDRLSIA